MGAPFVTAEELSEKLGGTDTATNRGTAVIAAACDMVRLFTEQELYPAVTAGTVLLDGTGTETLLLPQRPATDAGTVVESGGTLTLGTDYTLGTDGILYRTPGVIDGGWGTETLRTYWWPGRQNIEVTYSYGYSSWAMPPELKEVALGMAARLFVDQPASSNISEEEESLGQYGHRVRYATNGSGVDFSNSDKAIMRKYKQAKK